MMATKSKTPCYVYDLGLLNETLLSLRAASEKHRYHVHYALKANVDPQILSAIFQAGLGADCVSGNEVKKALEVGFRPNQIAFAGVGKTDEEILLGLEQDLFSFNCESAAEIEVINELALSVGKVARIALRINPNVNAYTHKYITTGLEENKFGIGMWELESLVDKLASLAGIKLEGLHFHIGSQLTDLSPYKNLCTRVNEINQWFLDRNITINHLNLGGGLGIDYENPKENPIPNFKAFFNVFDQFLKPFKGQSIHFELGRSIVGQCGSLHTKVLYIKEGRKTSFAIVDAGMTELLRPALYQAYHFIENVSNQEVGADCFYDVVGPICESSDCFGKKVPLSQTKRGDVLKIHSAGAYGQVMASKYNLRDQVQVDYVG